MKELKASDKVTQKMTHDGAVTENLATGEVTNISSRQPEADLSASSEESAGTAFDLAARVSEAHISHTERKEAKADREAVKEGSAARRRPSSRLQFTDEERADPALKSISTVPTRRRISWTGQRRPSPQRRYCAVSVSSTRQPARAKQDFTLRKWRKSQTASCTIIRFLVLFRN